jgi:hypothetical protein
MTQTKPFYFIFFFLIFLFPVASQSTEFGGYVENQWYTSTADNTVEFRLTKQAKENVPKFQMKTQIAAPADQVIVPILDYANYTATGMPKILQSNLRHFWEEDSLSFIMGKQRQHRQIISNATVSIVQFEIQIPNWWDRKYTLILASNKDNESGIISVYWTQYDEANFKTIQGPWKATAPSPYVNAFWGEKFDTTTYPNDNEDLYGQWKLIPNANDALLTDIEYETYIDPGWSGRKAMDSIIEKTIEDIPRVIQVVRDNLP